MSKSSPTREEVIKAQKENTKHIKSFERKLAAAGIKKKVSSVIHRTDGLTK